MMERPSLEGTYVRLNLPQDVVLSDVAEMADLLNLRVSGTTIFAPNPKIILTGGPGIDSILFLIASSGALGYIAGKFFDHILDEAFGNALAKLADAVRSNRRDERHVDELPWFVWTFTNSMDDDHVERLTLSGRFDSAGELTRMAREAREFIGTYDDAGIGGRSLMWRRTAQTWAPYDPEMGEPEDS